MATASTIESQRRTFSVGLVTPGWPADVVPNGISTYTQHIREGLRGTGTRVLVLSGNTAGECANSDIIRLENGDSSARPLSRLCKKILWRAAGKALQRNERVASLVRAVRRLSQDSGLDLLEMEDAFGLARPVATRVGVPIVVRLHGPWFLTGKWANDVGRDRASERRDRNEKLGIISAAGVSAPSRDVLDRCRHHFGLELANAEIIPNPIPPVTADERWSVNRCDQSRILFVGRFDRLKGGDLVIDAFRNLQLNKPNVQLTFIGQDRGVFTSDGTYCRLDEYLRSTVPSAAARQRFEWAGAVPHSKIAKFRRSAMVTVVASRYENFPYSLTEAMAQGCPVVAANVGGMREIVQHGENGLLFRPGDAKDLAAKIETLLDAPALAQRLGRQAVLDCHERYRPEIVANQMLGFYTRVLRRWDSGRV